MARHAHHSATADLFGRVALRVREWATRTERSWAARFPARRAGPHLSGGVLRETSVLAGIFAAALAAFGLLFILAAHPLRVRAPQPAAAVHGARTAPEASASARPPTSSDTAPAHSAASAAASTTAVAVTPPAVSTAPVVAAPMAASRQNDATSPQVPTDLVGVAAGQRNPNATVNPSAPPPSLQTPVSGAVLQGFGWAYSDVFGDWQQHTGVDLAIQPGERILSPGAGVVAAIRHDSLWGSVVSIVLDHGYSTNLSPFDRVDVQVGQPVQIGTPLGSAAGTSPAEATMPAHVFWQLFAGTRPIDPSVG